MTRKWRAFRSLHRDVWQEIMPDDTPFEAPTEVEAARVVFDYLLGEESGWFGDKDNLVLKIVPLDEDEPNVDWTLDKLVRWERSIERVKRR